MKSSNTGTNSVHSIHLSDPWAHRMTGVQSVGFLEYFFGGFLILFFQAVKILHVLVAHTNLLKLELNSVFIHLDCCTS
ncbi:hypothetical protein EXN66_Car022148 [Channa argus]|uniref:Uncharacterized protein n=1 Tax=Channa argus TaxID=215402 RepID=A0A6G1QWK9_CHAAH|nr:hypothetical protein EXN66_Car022148 [Channa argus]